jgi:hypothetical protein
LSFCFSARDVARATKSLVGAPLLCRRLRLIPSPSVSRTPPSPSYSLLLSLVLLLMPYVRPNLQQNEASAITQSFTRAATSPVASPTHLWTQSAPPTTLPRCPHRADHRHDLVIVQKSLETRQRSTLARPCRISRRNPNSPVSSLPCLISFARSRSNGSDRFT